MNEAAEVTRLFLIVPPRPDPARFAARLEEALGTGDVSAVLIASDAGVRDAEALAMKLAPIIQDAGAASLVADDTRLAGHIKADGVQIGSDLDLLSQAIRSFRPQRIVGAGNVSSRHAAMDAGELEPDYLFFGRPHGDTHDAAHPKALDLAEWWSEIAEVPAVVMAGRSLDSVREAAATGAAFVAVHDAVWSHADGPGAAIRLALANLGERGRRAA